ncbi:hypothetical protein C1Y40_03380 [Mycobacterium talmoniae]|uniref:Uncharacterized protein n=1 Tax=Mycobacterium talmoniae TaxID=1858794 RepID=A0A2S8BIE2_9MYCO|nr:hypothetical protein C1Y40_03380 [Mycobacterium talmoniae]
MNALPSQPSATSPVSRRFAGPIAATYTGSGCGATIGRSGAPALSGSGSG